LASSNLRIILTNVSDASIGITPLNAHLGIAGFSTYALYITSTNIIINAQTNLCLGISTMSNIVAKHPGSSIIGSMTSSVAINSTGGSCRVRLGVNSMSSVVTINLDGYVVQVEL